MPRNIFMNLPVADLKKSMAYYEGLGFKNNPQFTDETAACMVISEANYLMLLTHEKFKGFSKAPIADTKATTSLMVAVQLDSNAEVDQLAAIAVSNGGSEPLPTQDLGFMYSRTISDPDGHRFELFYMDMSQMPTG